MANGVVCPHCKSSLKGDFEVNEKVVCPNCSQPFIARELYISAFEDSTPSLSNLWQNHSQKILTGIAALLGLLVFIVWMNLPDSVPQPIKNADGTTQGTSQDANYFSSWDGSNPELVGFVKKGMKDPSSFEHVETRFRDDGRSYGIKMTFRGKNSYNATVTQTVTANLDKATRQLNNVQQSEL